MTLVFIWGLGLSLPSCATSGWTVSLSDPPWSEGYIRAPGLAVLGFLPPPQGWLAVCVGGMVWMLSIVLGSAPPSHTWESGPVTVASLFRISGLTTGASLGHLLWLGSHGRLLLAGHRKGCIMHR